MFGKSPAFAKIIPRTEGNKKLPFGNQLHAYTIVDAINDKNVLPFRVDYIKTMDMEEDIDDKQIEINIDYILMLVKKYHDSHCDDKEVLITIQKAIDASPELRSKKALIENFIAGINDVTDVMVEWREYVAQEKERQLTEIIRDENLKENETRQFMEIAFRDGAVKTTGTDIDKLLPPMSRFGGGNRAEKKQGVIAKLLGFFERFFGIG